MRGFFYGKGILAGALAISGLCAWGQEHSRTPFKVPSDFSPSVEVALNYEAVRSNTVPAQDFWMHGAGVQVSGQFTRHWSVAEDFSGVHISLMPGTDTGLDLLNLVFGPRYTFILPQSRIRIYGEAMGGVAFGLNSRFPNTLGSTDSATGSALLLGGGADYRISKKYYWRAVDASWIRTTLPNGSSTVQNNMRLGSGVVFRF
jgi:hypothetical protein